MTGTSQTESTKVGDSLIVAIHAYAWRKYGRVIEGLRTHCPYELNLKDDIHIRRQLATWFCAKWTNPDTGETVIDEYFRVHDRNDGAALRVMRMKEMIHGTFKVIDPEGMLILAKADDGFTYKIAAAGLDMSEIMRNYTRFVGQIFPWYPDGTYRTCGVITAVKSSRRYRSWSGYQATERSAHREDWDHWEARRRMDVADSLPVTSETPLRTFLKKFALDWVRQMYHTLGLPASESSRPEKLLAINSILLTESVRRVLDGLDVQESRCLIHVVKAGGMVPYHTAQKMFGKDDKELWWPGDRPPTVIGGLRKRGLVVIGVRQNDKKKVLVIPSDVLANLRDMGFGTGLERSADRRDT